MKSYYKVFKIFILICFLSVDFYPLAIGAEEAYSETATTVSKTKAKNEQKANKKIKDKSDFKENSNANYELEFTAYENMDLYFDYDVKEADYGYDIIKVNGEDASLKDVLQLDSGSNTIEIKKENYDNLNSLDVQTHITPEINVGIDEKEITVLINSPIEDTTIDMQIELPSNVIVDDSEISKNYLYNENQNKLKLTNLVSSNQYTIPVEIKAQTKENKEDKIKYNYTYTYDQKNYYEGSNIISVSMPVKVQNENQTQNTNIASAQGVGKNSNTSKTRLTSCSDSYANDFYYMNEDSKKSECEIDLGTNKDTYNNGIAMYRKYVNTANDFSINFTVEHNNNIASDKVGFYLLSSSLMGYTGENYYEVIQDPVTSFGGYYIYIDYEDDPGIHYGTIDLEITSESDTVLVDTDKIVDFDTSTTPSEDITFDINYNKLSQEMTVTISSATVAGVTFTQTISESTNYIMEFVSNFSSTAVSDQTDVDIMINSLQTTGEEIYQESLGLEGNAPNIVGDTMDYAFNTRNSSDRFKQIVQKQSTVSDLDGNPLDSNVITNAVIPDVNETVEKRTPYEQRVGFVIASLEQFLNDRNIILPNGVKVDTIGNIFFSTVENRVGDFDFTSGASYEIPTLLSTMTSTRSYKAVDLNATVGDNQQIEREEVIDLFNLQIHDGYLTPAGATTEDLFNSDRTYIQSESVFPIDTTKEGIYRFSVHYITSKDENLNLSLILEVKEPTTSEEVVIGESAKNVAYACELGEASCDNGVGSIIIPNYIILDVEYKIDALTHELTMRLTFNEKMYEAGDKTDLSRNLNLIISSPGSGKVVMTEDIPGTATGRYIGTKDVEGILGYEYEIKTGDLISQGLGLDGIYSISFTEGEEVVAVRSKDTRDTKTSFAIQVPKVKIIDGERYAIIGDGVNLATDATDISDQDVSTPDTVRYSVTTEEEAKKAYGIYELESICYEDAYGDDVDLDTATADETNWSENDLTLRKYDHVIRRCDGNYMIGSNVDATETEIKVETDKDGGFGDNGFRPIGQGPLIGEDVEFTGTLNGNQSKYEGSKLSSSITDLFINMPHTDNVGLVSINSGEINDLGLKNTQNFKTYITGKNNVGAIAGENRGSIINTYSKEGIKGVDYIGGLVGTGEGSIINSYTEGNIEGSNYVGGLTGSLGVLGTIENSYATGDITAQTLSGGLVGENSGTIKDVYAIGLVEGTDSLGGLVGSNIGSITNTYAAGNITGSTLIGGLVGNNTGTVTNGYGYALQAINGKFLELGGVNVIGNDSTYASFATYAELIDNVWYEDVLLYNTNVEQNKVGYDFTSPWTEEEEDSVSMCYPHIYRQENDGEYIPEQNCYKVSLPVDYKINAITLSIIIKFPAGLVSNLDVSVYNEDTGERSSSNVVVNSSGEMVLSPNVFTSIKQDSTLEITVFFSGKEMKVKIHTPRQELIDTTAYAVIGDGVNVDTDVSDAFNSDVSTPSTVKEAGIESSLVSGAPAYGVYELESIGYEKSDPKIEWTENDLTLKKYDHIIRPSSGRYIVRGIDGSYTDEEGKLGELTLDINGGFSTDTDSDGIADLNDGYRPIEKFSGTLHGEDEVNRPVIDNIHINGKSRVGIIGTSTGSPYIENLEVNNINYIGEDDVGGIIGQAGGETTVRITNVDVNGNMEAIGSYMGGLVGYGGGPAIAIRDSIVDIHMVGAESYLGGMIGKTSERYSIYDSYSMGDIVSSGNYVGGLAGYSSDSGTIGGSYNTGDVQGDDDVGGLVGFNGSDMKVENSYNTGNVIGSDYVGGILGLSNLDIELTNSYNTGNVTGNDYVGGIVGGSVYKSASTTANSILDFAYNTGEIRGNSYVGGLVGTYKGKMTREFIISNSFAVGDVYSNTDYTGAIAANVYGTFKINNGYGYEGQKVKVNGEDKNHLVGNDLSYDKRMSYEDAINDDWYATTLNWTDYTGVVVSETGELCYPHLINTLGVEGYKENQPCVVIEEPIDRTTTPKSIVNYKINAITLSVTIKLEDTLKLAKSSTIPVTVTSSSGTSITEDITIMEGNILNVNGEKYNIKPDDDITIAFTVAGENNTLKVHTPKQETFSFDANNDGTIDPDTEENLTYAVIGDGVNLDTDVEDAIGTSTASPSILEGEGEMSTLTPTAPAYGVYELESICANEQISATDLWTENDIVLTKYDHIIRPCGGNYILDSNIDALSTTTKTSTDLEGGFGSDGFESIGGYNEEFPFTGKLLQKEDTNYIIKSIYSYESSNIAEGLIGYTHRATLANLNIDDLVIKSDGDYVGGISGFTYFSFIINCHITGNIEGENKVGGFFGKGERTAVNDSSFEGDIVGVNDIGGMVGETEFMTIQDSDVKVNIVGIYYLGGLVGSGSGSSKMLNMNVESHIEGEADIGGIGGQSERDDIEDSIVITTIEGEVNIGGVFGYTNSGDVTNVEAIGTLQGERQIGGVSGYHNGGIIESSSFKGTIIGEEYIGGIMGRTLSSNQSFKIYNSHFEGDIAGGIYTGGLVGSIDLGTTYSLRNNYAKGTMTAENYVGGLVGSNTGGGTFANNYSMLDIEAVGKNPFDGEYDMFIGGLIGQNIGDSGNSTMQNCYSTGNITVDVPLLTKNVTIGGLVGEYRKEALRTNYYLYNNYYTGDISVKGHNPINLYVGGIIGSALQEGFAGGDLFIQNNLNTGNIQSTVSGVKKNQIGTVIGNYEYDPIEINYTFLNNYYYEGLTCTVSEGSCDFSGEQDIAVHDHAQAEQIATKSNLYDKSWWIGEEVPEGEIGDIENGLGLNLFDTSGNGSSEEEAYTWYLKSVENGNYPKLRQVDLSYISSPTSLLIPGQVNLPLPTSGEITEELLNNRKANLENKNRVDISSRQREEDIKNLLLDSNKELKDEEVGETLGESSNIKYSNLKKYMDKNSLDYNKLIIYANSSQNAKVGEILEIIESKLQKDPNYLDNLENKEIINFLNKFV